MNARIIIICLSVAVNEGAMLLAVAIVASATLVAIATATDCFVNQQPALYLSKLPDATASSLQVSVIRQVALDSITDCGVTCADTVNCLYIGLDTASGTCALLTNNTAALTSNYSQIFELFHEVDLPVSTVLANPIEAYGRSIS